MLIEKLNNLVLLIIATIFIISFLIGYLCGQLKQINGVYNNKPKSFFDQKQNQSAKISIDDTKYVTDINTNNLEKKYDQLGDTKNSDQKIDSAVNKLKNMKG